MYACTRTGPRNHSQESEQLVVKVCETRGEESILHAARHEAKLLKKIDSLHINRYIDFFEDPLINKTYLVLEDQIIPQLLIPLKTKMLSWFVLDLARAF